MSDGFTWRRWGPVAGVLLLPGSRPAAAQGVANPVRTAPADTTATPAVAPAGVARATSCTATRCATKPA